MGGGRHRWQIEISGYQWTSTRWAWADPGTLFERSWPDHVDLSLAHTVDRHHQPTAVVVIESPDALPGAACVDLH
jgi:hypothetical protein